MTSNTTNLPIESALPEIRVELRQRNQLLLSAAPGAGKSTIVPLRLLSESWAEGMKILLLEPRRLAARAVARRMAALLGEEVGQTVGYSMRMDRRVSSGTRLEVITEGVLTRRIQNNPELPGIACVIFDEFHERSLQADLGLALVLDVQENLRDDLKLLVMSATLDKQAIEKLLPEAGHVVSQGRAFPVETIYTGNCERRDLNVTTVRTILRALESHSGNLLVFLPGRGEILAVEKLLREKAGDEVIIAPLFGGLDGRQQDQAIQLPPPGSRKCVIATNIAETSLTIEGISIVIDCGLERRSSFIPRTGMSGLLTVEASVASVDQRRGRAGRLGPGVCYRMWSESRPRQSFAPAEIEIEDLADLVLQLRVWGVKNVSDLRWTSLPPEAHVSQAVSLLQKLGAIDEAGVLTAHGRKLAQLPIHPRLGNLMMRGEELGAGKTAADIAALLSERNPFPGTDAATDFSVRLRLFQQHEAKGKSFQIKRLRSFSRQLQKQINASQGGEVSAAILLAFAYPDRIGKKRSGPQARFKLSNGLGAAFAEDSSLVSLSPWIVVTELDVREREARVFSAAPLAHADIEGSLAHLLEEHESVTWDDKEGAVKGVRQTLLGELLLQEEALPDIESESVSVVLLQGIRSRGIECLPWTSSCLKWLARLRFVAGLMGQQERWPDYSENWLKENLQTWLLPWLEGKSRLSHLDSLDLRAILIAGLDWNSQQELDRLAPETFNVPSGSSVRINYTDYEEPVLPVKLQEMFSCQTHPTIADRKHPLLVHLLSPARRPIQITRDVPGFWRGSYVEVRKEMKGRYPKHHWPDDPLNAVPHQGTKKQVL